MQLSYRDIVLDEGWGGPFKWFVAASLIFHALVIYFSVAILPDLSKSNRPEVDLYTVQFLPLPPGPPPAAAEKAAVPKPAQAPKPAEKAPEEAATPPEPAEAAKVKPEESTPLVPVGPIKKPEPEIKRTDAPPPEPKVEVEKPKPKPTPPAEKPKPKPKPKPNPDAKINSAIENLQKKAQARSEEQQIEERMAQLKKSVGSNEGEVTAEGGVPDGKWVEGKRDQQLYYLQIYNIIQSNWNLPPESAVSAAGPLKAAYRIQIAPSGEVVGRSFKTKSGEDIFDAAIENAIKNSRLPKLPDSFGGRTITVDLYFTPEGVRKG
jgi:outer membrane biosynthesis protein TonB